MKHAQQIIGNLAVIEKEASKALHRIRNAASLRGSGHTAAAYITEQAAIEAVENIESMAAIMHGDLT